MKGIPTVNVESAQIKWIKDVQNEKKIGTRVIRDFNITEYEEPNYKVIDLRRIEVNKLYK